MLLTLKVLELNTFHNKWKQLLVIKTKRDLPSQKLSLEYKHKIQWCVDIFVLDSLILCLKVKDQLNLLIFMHQIIKKNDDTVLNYFKNGGMQFIWNT